MYDTCSTIVSRVCPHVICIYMYIFFKLYTQIKKYENHAMSYKLNFGDLFHTPCTCMYYIQYILAITKFHLDSLKTVRQ